MICSTPNCCELVSTRTSKSVWTHFVSAATRAALLASSVASGGSWESKPKAASL